MQTAMQIRSVEPLHYLNTTQADRGMRIIKLNIPDDKLDEFWKAMVALGIDLDAVEEVGHIESNEELPEWQKKMLDERWQEYLKDKTKVTSWEDFEKEFDEE